MYAVLSPLSMDQEMTYLDCIVFYFQFLWDFSNNAHIAEPLYYPIKSVEASYTPNILTHICCCFNLLMMIILAVDRISFAFLMVKMCETFLSLLDILRSSFAHLSLDLLALLYFLKLVLHSNKYLFWRTLRELMERLYIK